MTAILSVLEGHRAMAARLFAVPVCDLRTGGGRDYLLYELPQRGRDLAFTDPKDGALLVELKYFDDEFAARQWVAEDIALRNDALTAGVQ